MKLLLKKCKISLKKENLTILKLKGKYTNSSNTITDLEIEIKVDEEFNTLNLLSILQNNHYIKSIEL